MFSESMFPDLDDVLCVEDASNALKISSQAVYKYLKSGELRGFRNGKVWRIPKAGLSYCAFSKEDFSNARKAEPLEQVIDIMKETLRTRHFLRLQKGECSAAAGFVWSDLLTNLERVSDHCSNISGAVLDTVDLTMNIHENQRIFRESDEEYKQQFSMFQHKYKL